MDIAELDELLNKFSGLKGLTGNGDMREVREAAAAGDEDAKLALGVYIHRLVKYVGAYAAEMNGIDALVFTAGVGENNPNTRQEVVDNLGFLGFAIDDAKNQARSKEPRIISPDGAEKLVLVVPTNEELEIARSAIDAIG
jgi:acetate kinase